jgi:lactoylglutathione lyase
MDEALRCELFPDDLGAALAFYIDVLRFRPARDERARENPYIALERGMVRLGLAARPTPPHTEQRRPPVGVELVLEVDDVVMERAHVEAAGWPVVKDLTEQPWGLVDFRLLDPNGYYWRITSRSP